MKKIFVVEIDTEHLASVSDEYLAAYWYRAQFLPVEHGDHDACEAVRAISVEIIKRWMGSQPIPMFNIQPADYWIKQFRQFARWNGSEWIAAPTDGESRAPAFPQTTTGNPTETPAASNSREDTHS
ncbi:hypothetical protein [Paraburkholderia sp. SIMBA_030]|uniref:hypothetical protein n=1 Tax=Paraburkholderia sp. SIMBA_030 TaxID=3085773 RepID=UPI00397BDBF1